jgi:hypothetical protein
MTTTELDIINKKVWLEEKEVVIYMGLSRKTVQKYRNKGTDQGIFLLASRIGGRIKYKRTDVDKFLSQHQQ